MSFFGPPEVGDFAAPEADGCSSISKSCAILIYERTDSAADVLKPEAFCDLICAVILAAAAAAAAVLLPLSGLSTERETGLRLRLD